MASEKLQVVLELVSGQYKREAKEAATATGQIGTAAGTSSKQVDLFGRNVESVGKKVSGLATGALVAAGAGMIAFAKDSVKAASDLEESMNAVNVVFGTAADKIVSFGEQAATSAGLAQAEFQQMATVLGSSLINAGIPLDEAAEKTIELTQRAADMASVFNTTVPDALGAMQAALRGEADPIERFGVTLTAAAVNAEAAALGFAKVGGEFDAQAKAAARLSLIMKQTDRVQGDFANTSDGLANSSRILAANMTDLQAKIGSGLAPVLAELTSEALDSIEAFGGFLDIIDKVIDATVGSGGAADDARESLTAYNGIFDFLLPNLTVGFAQFNDLNTTLDENAAAAARAMEAARFMADAQKDDLIPVVFDTIVMLDRQSTSHGNAARAADTQRRAMINLANASADLLDPVGNVIRLTEEFETAQQNLADVVADSASTDRDKALAVLDVEQAFLRLQAAGAALTPDQIQAFSLILIEQLGLSEQQALDTLAALNLLDGWTGTATFTLRMNEIASGGGGGGNINTDIVRFHGGGIVPGPRGSEQLILAQGGEGILSLSQMSRGGSMTSNRYGGNIVVMSPSNNLPMDLQYAALLANHATFGKF